MLFRFTITLRILNWSLASTIPSYIIDRLKIPNKYAKINQKADLSTAVIKYSHLDRGTDSLEVPPYDIFDWFTGVNSNGCRDIKTSGIWWLIALNFTHHILSKFHSPSNNNKAITARAFKRSFRMHHGKILYPSTTLVKQADDTVLLVLLTRLGFLVAMCPRFQESWLLVIICTGSFGFSGGNVNGLETGAEWWYIKTSGIPLRCSSAITTIITRSCCHHAPAILQTSHKWTTTVLQTNSTPSWYRSTQERTIFSIWRG